MTASLESFPLREVATRLLAGAGRTRWQIREDDQWCHLAPAGNPTRIQGWKLHVSATWLSAPLVLHQAAQVLLRHGCAFKFAASLPRVLELTSKDADRAQAGKFITAYPRDDAQLRMLAPLLDQATAGLPGPAVLSDRPYREGSLVSYRFGAFTGVPVQTNDGSFERRLEAPDGTLVADVRQPWFCPPPWATPPWVTPPYAGNAAREATPPATPRPVLLGGRFRVVKAIRHSARGGVYRAVDQQTGHNVVIKQARAHISGLTRVGDAQAGLRHESAMLAVLAGLAPREVSLFSQGEHLFLAVEELPGEPLAAWPQRWVSQPAQPGPDEGPPVADAVAVAGRLAELVQEIHQRGVVFRDLAPGNVMILTDGSLRLVDTELVARPGAWVTSAHTPGFVAPEVLAGPAFGPAPEPSADLYSLGALLCFLATGAAPPVAMEPSGETTHGRKRRVAPERMALLLRYASARSPAARRLAPAILGLTAADPAKRWTAQHLRQWLASPAPDQPSLPDRKPRAGLEADRVHRLARDGVAVLATLPSASPERPVLSSTAGMRSDPYNVHHGAAGVLGVLVRASELGEPGARAAAARLARWIDRRRLAGQQLLPGLYFGRAGTAWALYDAARHLDQADLAERAIDLALALPVRWPNPDLTHGTAGVGMASAHLWYETKEPALRERVVAAADWIMERVAHTPEGRVYWQVPPEFDSKLAGARHLGFAHGVAGIGAFLLAAGAATGESRYLQLAEQAGQTLAAAVVGAGATYWPNDIAGPGPSDLRYHWCSGASGVGTFLVRLWQATGVAQYRELAEAAAVSVHRGRWLGGVSACHGLAGNAEFLLDLAEAGGGPYRGWAEEIAAAIYTRHGSYQGRMVVGDEPTGRPNLDYSTGLAGVVGFLLRLRHGGRRWWMADPPQGWQRAPGWSAEPSPHRPVTA